MSHVAGNGGREWRLGYRPHLDGLRALAVASVVLFHAHLIPGGGTPVGVTAFFVLSGYLITALLVAELSSTDRVAIGAFYLRRARRLLPALSVVLVVSAILLVVRGEHDLAAVSTVASVSYLANWFIALGVDLGPLNHVWSLSVEEQFYVTWPLVFLVVRPRAHLKLAIAVLIVAAAVTCWRTWALLSGWPLDRAGFSTDMQADGLLVGCAIGLVGSEVRTARMAGAAGVLGLLALMLTPLTAATWTLTIISTVAVIAGTRSGGDRLLGTFLAYPTVTHVGRISYGIYLWHYPVMWYLGVLDSTASPGLIPVSIVVTVLLAELSFRYVERPFMRLSFATRTAAAERA